MSKTYSRATVTGTTLSGATLKASLTTLWDALQSLGLTDSSRTTVTATGSLAMSQCGTVAIDATSGAITLTLPTSGTATDEALFRFRRIDSTANVVAIQRGGSDTIDGVSSISIPPNGVVEMQIPAGSTTWRVYSISSSAPVQQSFTAFTTAGTAPAYTLSPTPSITALTANQRYRLKIHSATTGACTLAVSGLTATAIKQYDYTGAKIDPTLALNQLVDVEYDGTNWVVLDPLPSATRQIQPVTASVASNALTATLNPTSLDFRSATLGSGTVVTRNVSAAISVVVPSSATLGTVNAVASRLVLLAIDNAGTVELAVVNISGGNNLDETTLISTTAISAAATAANVIYSTTARTGVAFRVVGFVDSTQATAGTWATAPSTIQGMGGVALSGMMGVGFGQTWQSVTRNPGTTYYNTTGRPIVLAVYGSNGSASCVGTISINGGTALNFCGCSLPSGTALAVGDFLIPAGASYNIGGITTMTNAYELR